MEKKYVVKDFESQTYYAGQWGNKQNWDKDPRFAEYFNSLEDAGIFISRENGRFQIELVYITD
jgi:hypothetical protein